MAQNVVRDFGEEAASSSGLSRLSKCNVRSAERDAHRVLSKGFKLTLPIPLFKLGRGKKLSHAVLCLKDWISFMLTKNCWHILTGLVRPDQQREADILQEFWRKFRLSQPEHPVFKLEEDGSLELCRTVPLLWHGHEGRGRRRQPFLVTSFHSFLGRGIRPGLRAQKKAGVQKAYLKLKPNFVGHAYTHRMLHTALAKSAFEDDEVFSAVLDHCVQQAHFMQTTGVVNPHSKKRHFAILLGVTGDWAFLFKSGRLSRSYSNVEKHVNETKVPAGICHLCRAGQRGFDFEQIQSRHSAWLPTFCTQSPFSEPVTPLTNLLHPPGMQATIFKFDAWHSWHLGVGKSFVASTLALMSNKYIGRSKDSRMALLSADFMSWCRATRHTPTLSKLTASNINWESNTTFPFGSWFKGSVTTTLCSFIQHQLRPQGPDMFEEDDMLALCSEAVLAINTALKGLYENDVFLPASTAREIGEQGLRFLRRYASLARKAVDNGQILFCLIPKLHSMHHLLLQDLVLASESFEFVVNPICYSVQLSEDFIGQLSRLSRRVHPSRCSQRRIERHLQLAYSQYVKAGYLVEGKD